MSDRPTQSPKISIKLDVSPTTYHFSNPTPPTLTITLTSHASCPLTISIPYGSPLKPTSAMSEGGFPIFDLSTSPPTPVPITDLTGRINRPPSPPDLLSLHPGESASISVAFTRGGSYDPKFRPQPWHVVRKGGLVDKDGKKITAQQSRTTRRSKSPRRSKTASGADGLEVGKTYKVTIAKEKLLGKKWWWGTKEEVQSGAATTATFEEDGKLLQLPLYFEVEDDGVEFRVEE